MHCYSCGGANDWFNKTGFLSGWAVSNTCRACLKAESTCQKCGWTGPRGGAYFLKYPDCGPGGLDIELFACKTCADEFTSLRNSALGGKL